MAQKSAEQIALELQAQIAAQIASVSSLLHSAHQEKEKKKAAYIPLLLDAQGRQIDEKGNLVKQDYQVKTLAANVAGLKEQKKKENPYLSHKQPAPKPTLTASSSSTDLGSATPVSGLASVAPALVPAEPVFDDRLRVRNREAKAKRTFQFVEPGTLIKHADQQRHKEERKVIAGYASGRRAPELAVVEEELNPKDGEPKLLTIAGTADEGLVPAVEWWDEVLLPKAIREARRKTRAAQEVDDYENANILNCRTHKLIHHPVPVKPLGGERPEESLPMYLTKRERKRIRRQAREEREREKRDKMIMGLIPAPETKFKLSNFMKILGDQAVADPSKVEMRVIKEMQKRQLNHMMRNLARKLTPAERKEKKRKRLMEDTSRQVHTAIFRVKDFTFGKLRFKVDVNAQQLNLTGTVLLCPSEQTNLIVFEGGPKGIRKIKKLMLKRINWDDKEDTPLPTNEDYDNEYYESESDEDGQGESTEGGGDEEASTNKNSKVRSRDEITGGGLEGPSAKRARTDDDAIGVGESSATSNRCDFLWEGILAKRVFHVFRFQECKTASAARKVLEAKGIPHYWDMAMRADDIMKSTSVFIN